MSFDYAYVGDKGEIASREEAELEEGSVTILVVRDSATKAVRARGAAERRRCQEVCH